MSANPVICTAFSAWRGWVLGYKTEGDPVLELLQQRVRSQSAPPHMHTYTGTLKVYTNTGIQGWKCILIQVFRVESVY